MKADILIVDDLPDNLSLLSSMLMKKNYQIRNAINAQRAFKAIQRQMPDLILLDIKLPDLDGYEVCRRLKASSKTSEIPIIFISALDDVFDKVLAFEVGGVDYITKPFQVFEVMARVGNQLQISRLQHELTQQNEQLEKQNKLLNQEVKEREKAQAGLKFLLHAVSHDLRTPMMGMSLSFQSYLIDDKKDIFINRLILERMYNSCERQIRLINSLVETSETEIWEISLNLTLISFEDFLKDLLADWNSIFVENKVEIKCEIAPNLPLIRVDVDKLWRVFENLIGNAIKYNKSNFSLTIIVRYQDNEIYCEVIDNGIGINDIEQENLFNIYTRGAKINGKISLGLGLYLCRKIVNAHGGKIGVKSQLKSGSVFWFTLPLK